MINLLIRSKLILIFLLLPAYSIQAFAGKDQAGHMIMVRIINCQDTLLYLNHFSGKDIVNDDTANRNPDGYFIFNGIDTLDAGLYFISSTSNKRYFDFFITDSQKLKFECDLSDVVTTMATSDSLENRTYYNTLANLQANVLRQGFVKNDSVQYLIAHADFSDPALQKIFLESSNHLTFSEKYIKACILPATYQQYFLPKPQAKEETAIRSYLDHFFDNLDFSDHRLIYTPVFTKRIDEFLDTLSTVPEQSLSVEVDRLIDLSSSDKKTQEFLTWHLISRFGSYYFLPGYDVQYVHIVNNFLANGKIAWYYPEVKDRELSQAKKFESLLTGKTGPDLEMPDTTGIYHSLYSVNARYTLLLFWATTCSHCRDEMPSIIKLYKEFHKDFDLEIFGVSTDTSMTRWKSYIKRHQLAWINVFGRKNTLGSYHQMYNVVTTPILFLLDDKKTILAKYLTPEKMGEMIRNRESQYRRM